jgi:hypothetical protein
VETTAARAFKDLVDQIAGALRKRGFARRGTILFHERGENSGLIEFQKSQKTRPEAVLFTVNLGVVSGRLARFFSVPLSRGRPPEPSKWHWRVRLGFLLPEGQDQWWSLRGGSEVRQVREKIEDALVRLALPEIEEHLRDESLRDLWLTGRSPGLTDVQRLKNLAVLLKALGPEHRLAPILENLRLSSKANAALIEQRFQAGASV